MALARLSAAPRLAPIVLLGSLVAYVLVLALWRLHSGPWYAVYAPDGTRVLEGAPASWEARYYLDVVANFVTDEPPLRGFAPVHHRTLTSLYLVSLLYAWTGRVYVSLTAVDVLFWVLAGVAVFQVSRRLRLPPIGAGAAALVASSSPLFASAAWHQVMHHAEFASMALGLWAIVAAIDEQRSARKLLLTLGGILLLLSLSYQYQWTLLPMLAVLLRGRAGFSIRKTAFLTAGSLAVFALATLAWRSLLHLGGLSPHGGDVDVVANPGDLIASRLSELRSPSDVLRVLPNAGHLAYTVRAYHPIVFAAGWLGLLLLPRHALVSALVASGVALVATSLYSAPWTAMSAYPFIYVGAGRLCAVGCRWGALPGAVIAIVGAVALSALTNADLWGDYRFMLEWWRQYAPQTVF